MPELLSLKKAAGSEVTTNKKQFRVEYTATAFEQDSSLAMKGSVVRALIELITNCDDAYSRAKKTGPILIEVYRREGEAEPARIAVRDNATGLDRKGMEESFIQLGGDRSGFKTGEAVRGLFSRGSKDTSWFGSTTFESIKEGEYSRLTLNADSSGEVESTPATAEHYLKLALPEGGNGLSASMTILRENTRIPDIRELCERLASHVQLREITQRHDVLLTEYRKGKRTQHIPVLWDPPSATTIFDSDIVIPGFHCSARLTINKMEQRVEGPVSDHSIHGIEIRGARAVYENSDFSQSAGGMALLRGHVISPKIDELIRGYEPQGSKDQLNPMMLVTRSRDGLEPAHPFTQALATAVVERLKPILEQLEPKVNEGGGDKFRRDLSHLGRLLAAEMRADLEEDEDSSGPGVQPTPTSPIVLIPPKISAQLSSTRTVTALVHKHSEAAQGLQAHAESDAISIVQDPLILVEHARLPETLIGRFRVRMNHAGTSALVVSAVTAPTISATATVEIHEFADDEEPPQQLEWKNNSMSVSVGKTRTIQLRAPIEIAPSGELEVSVELSGSGVSLEDRKTTLRLIGKGWLTGTVRVTGKSADESPCRIIARSDQSEALGQIRAVLAVPPGGFSIVPRLVDDFKGPFRGEIKRSSDIITLDIFTRHKGLSRYLGTRKKDGSYSNENDPQTQAVMAEIMASVASDHVIRRQAERDPGRFATLDQTLFERTKILDRYLRILLEGLRQSEAKQV